jgi:hypothetical protein
MSFRHIIQAATNRVKNEGKRKLQFQKQGYKPTKVRIKSQLMFKVGQERNNLKFYTLPMREQALYILIINSSILNSLSISIE